PMESGENHQPQHPRTTHLKPCRLTAQTPKPCAQQSGGYPHRTTDDQPRAVESSCFVFHAEFARNSSGNDKALGSSIDLLRSQFHFADIATQTRIERTAGV